MQDGSEGEYTVHFNSYAEGGKVGKPDSIKVDVVIGADGANSRVAKEIDAGMLPQVSVRSVSWSLCTVSPNTPSHTAQAQRWRIDCSAGNSALIEISS